jgi:hypothetical protein
MRRPRTGCDLGKNDLKLIEGAGCRYPQHDQQDGTLNVCQRSHVTRRGDECGQISARDLRFVLRLDGPSIDRTKHVNHAAYRCSTASTTPAVSSLKNPCSASDVVISRPHFIKASYRSAHTSLTSSSKSRGLDAPGRILLRAAMESLFKLKAVERDRNVVNAILAGDDLHRKGLLKKYKRIDDPELQAELDRIGELKSPAADSFKEWGVTPLTVEQMAEKADMTKLYLSTYPVLSDAAHAGIRDLERQHRNGSRRRSDRATQRAQHRQPGQCLDRSEPAHQHNLHVSQT